MKERYIDLMEKALSAYSNVHILRYFAEVREKGLTEHGFPRLTANIGILASHGRRQDLIPIFREMMEFCCTQILRVKAANDFSVREIICCLRELDSSGIIARETLDRWKKALSALDPWKCYTVTAKAPEDPVKNWALFTAVSEYFRQQYGLCESEDFIDLQIASQLKWFDENGMYMDKADSKVHHPMVYDVVPRGLFSLMLHFGYRGKHYARIDAYLKKAALLALGMQSACGELPYGGRSNQFIHNEAWVAAVFEFEANRYAAEGNAALAAEFKRGCARAVASAESWLEKTPIRHIKNRFPTETKYGCEEYAYFDKYMITAASFLYAAYLMCDDSISAETRDDPAPAVCRTSKAFHKLFLKCGEYSAQLDINADPHYDASGLGRLHRKGAPTPIALSVPCPAQPEYTLDIPEPMALSICPGIFKEGKWQFATEDAASYRCEALESGSEAALTKLLCRFDGQSVSAIYTLDAGGLTVEIAGEGDVACLLPAFYFDGESYADIRTEGNQLTVSYGGWECRYTATGQIRDLRRLGGNRNGHYKAFFASATNNLKIRAEICKTEA